MTASHRSQTRSDHHPDRVGEATERSTDPRRVSSLSFGVAGSTNKGTPPLPDGPVLGAVPGAGW
jgi:hypothetical protein